MGARLIHGGRSNLTYRLDLAAGPVVLRRPPLGHALPTAHDMSREFRVLSALNGTAVPVPAPLARCDDSGHHRGALLPDAVRRGRGAADPPGRRAADPGQAGQLSAALAVMLARIHDVDLAAAGLDGFGRPDGYLARQLARWQRQWELSATRDLPGYDTWSGGWPPGCRPAPRAPWCTGTSGWTTRW